MDEFVYDPAAPDFQERMFEIYRTMRDEHPVYRHPDGHFALTRHADIVTACSDAATFSSVVEEASTLLPMMIYQDPPRHPALRAVASRAFTPRRVAGLESRVRLLANELLDALEKADEVDLLEGFASLLPSIVVGELIGVPHELLEPFRVWTESFLVSANGGENEDAGKIYALFAELLAQRRLEPRDDLMSALLAAEVDGQHLTEPELLGFCFLLVLGGNDTTRNLLGNGAELLARHVDQRAELVRDPSLIPNAIEEMLRIASPTQALPRTTTRDVEMHGTTIPQGARVMLVFGAGNLDDRVFEQPERFDIRRTINRHLAFGHGAHFCMGASLARLEARVGFEELLRRHPRYELAAEPVRLGSIWARTFESIPVVLDPRS